MSKGRWKRQTKTGLRQRLREALARVAELEAMLAQAPQPKPRLKWQQPLPPRLEIPVPPAPETDEALSIELSDEDDLGEGRWL